MLPSDYHRVADQAWNLTKDTAGYLSEQEARFLMLAATCTPGTGANVEIGSFKGRSTVAIGHMIKHYGLEPLDAIDPHTAPAATDPKLHGQTSTYDDYVANLERANVQDVIRTHKAFSRDFIDQCPRPIRFLWIDGDHTLEGVREDIRLFKPLLRPGAVLAMHDVLGTMEGPLRVFAENILGSDDFGPAGFCGSIGWAQYLPGLGKEYRFKRSLLRIPTQNLIPVAQSGQGLKGLHKLRYKIWRPLAPHGPIDPAKWVQQIDRRLAA